MTTPDHVRDVVNRLERVDWTPLEHRTWSRAKLMGEHLRRVALWNRFLGCGSKTPFFDLPACAGAGPLADLLLVESLVARCQEAGAGIDVRKLLPFIVHWAAMDRVADLPDPYEPLIRMFERGGGHRLAHGGIDLVFITLSLRNWQDRADRAEIPSMDDAALDEVDRAGSLEQFGEIVGPA